MTTEEKIAEVTALFAASLLETNAICLYESDVRAVSDRGGVDVGRGAFRAWHELSESERKPWRDMAKVMVKEARDADAN